MTGLVWFNFQPALAIARTQKLGAIAAKTTAAPRFKLFDWQKILDKNSPNCFHKLMPSDGLQMSPVHRSVHGLWPNIC